MAVEKRTESVTATEQTVKLLKGFRGYPGQLTKVAHNLDFVAILDDIEEDQFASGKSIRTYPTY